MVKIINENIIEEKNNFIIIEADEDTRDLNELEDNEKMVVLVDINKPDEHIKSFTVWNTGAVTVFNLSSFDEHYVSDYDTALNELCEYIDLKYIADSHGLHDIIADNLISELEDYDDNDDDDDWIYEMCKPLNECKEWNDITDYHNKGVY